MRDWYTKIVQLLKKITVSVYKKTGVEPEQFKKMKNIILRQVPKVFLILWVIQHNCNVFLRIFFSSKS